MAQERVIDVRKQRDLSGRDTFRLCVSGISHRMLRSVLTLAVVVLAVAFFMFLLSENTYVSAVARGVWGEIDRQRFSAYFLNEAFSLPTRAIMARRLASVPPEDADRTKELATVVGWPEARMAGLIAQSRREAAFLDFFNGMSLGKRAILAQKRRGREILRALVPPEAQEEFRKRIQPMLDLRVPEGLDAFLDFASGYAAYESELDAFTADWRASLTRLAAATRALTGDLPAETWLVDADDEAAGAWAKTVRDAGFRLSDEQFALLRDQLRASSVQQDIARALVSVEKQELWRQTFRERKRLSTEEKLLRLDDERAVAILDNAYPVGALADVARRAAVDQRLDRIERGLSGKVERRSAKTLGGRQLFLLFISFLVCMAGIANAMLMSITERFREIATMKCLGATDRFILVQFMMEAAIQGVVGASCGMLIGWLIATLRNAVSFGGYVFAFWPGAALVGAAAMSLLTGVLLAILASIYPSWAASRMAPMEAMRIE